MSSSGSPNAYQSCSPLASTEEKSIQDNIDINKLNLEKGLKNRPNCDVLVDRGILLNHGKAYSDKMHQLDLAKKRDRLKKKIENRPDRDELVRKLILKDGDEGRKNERIKIKQMLDSSINYRPGSLELIDKNILKVDHLLASKIHHGDISFPKVCRDDVNFESNMVATLPSISEIDLQNSLADLSEVLSQSNAKPSSNKGAQISCKKTCRVGRFSFHNIEFRPTAQKAREFQQNELLEYEKIQAQHDPSLRMVHSELTLKSRNTGDTRAEKARCLKYSLLNRLNVHELKSECKLRFISCSNIPKAQLVERLLPYEAEVLRSHTSFDQNRINTPDRRSYSSIQGSLEYSPPDLMSHNNLTPPPYHQSTVDQLPSTESLYNGHILSKISHSQSEPTIQDFNNQLNVLSIRQFNAASASTMNFYNNPATFNPNSSYPLLNGDVFDPHQSIKSESVFFQSQPHTVMNGFEFTGIERKIEPLLIQHSQQSVPEQFYNSSFSNKNSTIFSDSMKSINYLGNTIPEVVQIPLIPYGCDASLDIIRQSAFVYKTKVDEINRLKNQNTNHVVLISLFDEYSKLRNNLLNLCSEMLQLLEKKQRCKMIDEYTASRQLKWLIDLQELVKCNFNNCTVKFENHLNGSDLLSQNFGGCVPINNDEYTLQHESNCLDDFDMTDLLNTEPNKSGDQSLNNNIFLESDKLDSIWSSHNPYSSQDLQTPETPLSEICNSPMSTDYLDQFMNELLNPLDNHFI